MSDGINKSLAAYIKIKEGIINGYFKAGQNLYETKLCELLGISRTPIREALRKLNSEGFVQYIENKGIYVSKITIDKVNEIFEARACLEVYALKLCIQKSGDEIIPLLKKTIKFQERALAQNNHDEFKKYDLEFHQTIIMGAKNNYIETFWVRVIDHVNRMINNICPHYIYKPNTVSFHIQIQSLIEDGDFDLAESLLSEHVMMMRDEIIEKIASEQI